MNERLAWLYWLTVLVMGVFAVRLLNLQLVDGRYYRRLADENRLKLEKIPAVRGELFDRFGEPVVITPAKAHVLGYVGEISEEELADCQEKENCQFELKDVIGKMGIEAEYDQVLRGTDGLSILEKDAHGQTLRELKRVEPVRGENLQLTLDSGLQEKAFSALAGRLGAVVASQPQTGEILALISGPGFEVSNLEKYLRDPDLALFNRAVSGEYPPGSTFKVITATAALEEAKIDAETEIEDTGEIRIGPYRFGNWYFDQYGRKEGLLTLVQAIKRSNDIFFYHLGESLGIRLLADWAKYFGLDHVTGIDLPGEAQGLMPSPEWKEEKIKDSWYLGDTYIAAIGQGYILTTPLQVNQMMGVIASKGYWCRPHLVNPPIGGKAECKKLDINEKTIQLVTEGLKKVCQTGGTAWPFFDFPVTVAGKTGTAEFGDPQKRTHAWFTGFAPAENPEIVITVLLEAAGEGSDQAAPVAKEILNYWFNR